MCFNFHNNLFSVCYCYWYFQGNVIRFLAEAKNFPFVRFPLRLWVPLIFLLQCSWWYFPRE